jgi:predicted phage terminase large subunit-like protein
MPALAEKKDILKRKEGEPLWPTRWSRERLMRIKQNTDWYTWAGLFQQRPVALEGGLVKKHSLRYYIDRGDHWECITSDGSVRVQKRYCSIFQVSDLAASEKERRSYTVISTWALDRRHGFLLLLDVLRFRQESPDVKKELRAAYRLHTPAFLGIERAQIGIDAVQELSREGFAIKKLEPKGDKVTRFLTVAAMYENNQVYHPKEQRENPWLGEWEYEILMFPEGKYNDQADTAAYAGHIVSGSAIGAPIAKDAMELSVGSSRWRGR